MKDKYYDYILEKVQSDKFTKEERIVFELIFNMSDRRGFRESWETLDLDVQEEWLVTWVNKVRSML